MAMSFFKDRTLAPRNVKRSASLPLQIGSVSHIGARESQQDSFGISDVSNTRMVAEQGVLTVVADGMGGLSEGDIYSSQAVECFLRRFSDPSPLTPGLFSGDPADWLLDLLTDTGTHIFRMLDEYHFPLGGSTVVATIIHEGLLHYISVGDSRIYLMRGGSLLQLNREHIYGAELDENAVRGGITFAEARSDPQRHALTSYLGMERLAHIDRNVHPVRLLPKDYVLLMTDGVFGTLTESKIAAAVRDSAAESANRLGRAVLNKSKANQDNFTAIIIGCL